VNLLAQQTVQSIQFGLCLLRIMIDKILPVAHLQAQGSQVLRQAIVDFSGDATTLLGDSLLLRAARLFGGVVFDNEDAAPQVVTRGGRRAQPQRDFTPVGAAAARF